MASSSITLTDEADANIVYTLVGQNENSAFYKNTDRELSLPQELRFQYKLGNPGSKGNDQIICKLKNTVENDTTNLISVGSVTVTLSVPRDSAWTNQMSEDLLIQLQDLFADANAIKLADAVTP